MTDSKDLVSEINEMIDSFMKKPPKTLSHRGRVYCETDLLKIKTAVNDLLEDKDAPGTQDMLKAYCDQVKQITGKGQDKGQPA